MRRERPLVVYLWSPASVLAERVRGSGRPSLTGRLPEDEIEEVLARRDPVFRKLARTTIDTSQISFFRVIDHILDCV